VIGKRTVDIMSEDQSSWSDLSWQDLAIEPKNTQGSPLVVGNAGREEGDWLDGQQLSKRTKDIVKSRATFNVRGLFLGTKLWLPPVRLGESQDRDQYEFAREGLYLYLDYSPNLDTKAEAHFRMVGTTVEITAKFSRNYPVNRHHWTLLVSEVKQLPSEAAIQKRLQSNKKKAEHEDSNRPR
jgi:hypothetical protein